MNAPLDMTKFAAQVCGMAQPDFAQTNLLEHINALASVNCVDDISRREKLASIKMLSDDALSMHKPINKLAITSADTKGLYQYDYTGSEGLELSCYLEYEAAERATFSEPGCSESITLVYALHKGEDISEVLSSDVAGLIEEEALASMEMDKWNDEYDKGEERALDRGAA